MAPTDAPAAPAATSTSAPKKVTYPGTVLQDVSDILKLAGIVKRHKPHSWHQKTAAAGTTAAQWTAIKDGESEPSDLVFTDIDPAVVNALTINDLNLVHDMNKHHEGGDLSNAIARSIIVDPNVVHPCWVHPVKKTWFDDSGYELLLQPPARANFIHVAQNLEAEQIALAKTLDELGEAALIWYAGAPASPNFYPYTNEKQYAYDVTEAMNEFGGEPVTDATGRVAGTLPRHARLDSEGAVVGGQSTRYSEKTATVATGDYDDDYYGGYYDADYDADYEDYGYDAEYDGGAYDAYDGDYDAVEGGDYDYDYDY